MSEGTFSSSRCPTCGAVVRVVGSDEGTMHYVPVPAPSDEEETTREWVTRLLGGSPAAESVIRCIEEHEVHITLLRQALGVANDRVANFLASESADMPRREAEVRAATLREVEAWIQDRLEPGGNCVTVNLDGFAAHFNPDAER